MADLQDKLKGLLATTGLMTGAQWQDRAAEIEEQRASGDFEIDKTIPGEIIGDEESAFYLVRQDFPLETPHGNTTLGAALGTLPHHIALSASDAELADFDIRSAVFVDTETTGLAGGAGTVTFLVGVGYFTDDAFRLDQCFMRDYDDEEPMLEYLDEVFRRSRTLVSYNGKSFDLPLLRTRFITNRIPYRLEGLAHFDLVHAARRFWKKRLGDCSLGNIERAILGIRRTGDIPGSEIPRIWLDYLHTRDARPLVPVFNHHKMDILSLVALTATLSQALEVPDGEGFEHHADRLSLVRVHFRQKQYAEVLDLSATLLDALSDEALRHELHEMTGFAAKRLQRWDVMETAWTAVLEEFPRDLMARHELAKHYEHRKRDLPAAARMCEEALQHTGSAPGHTATFRHRLDRIQKKLKKYGYNAES